MKGCRALLLTHTVRREGGVKETEGGRMRASGRETGKDKGLEESKMEKSMNGCLKTDAV